MLPPRICSLLLIVAALLFSCQSGIGQSPLEPKDFKERMEKGDVVVLDVRTPAEFSDGHLPGALNIDVKNESFSSRISELDSSKTYLLYCRSGNRTKTAVGIMKEAGFKNLIEMKGGYPDWEAAGYPVEK